MGFTVPNQTACFFTRSKLTKNIHDIIDAYFGYGPLTVTVGNEGL